MRYVSRPDRMTDFKVDLFLFPEQFQAVREWFYREFKM